MPSTIERLCSAGYTASRKSAATYRRVENLDPDNAQARLGLGLLSLLKGDFEAGWARHDARFKMSSSAAYPKFSQPMWLGEENIEGKTILIHVDEGLGDTIQFARYVPQVAARGANVILVVADAVQPLLSELRGVVECLPLSTGTLPAFDMHCPLSNLPRYSARRSIRFQPKYPICPPRHGIRFKRGAIVSAAMTNCGWDWSGPAIPITATTTTDRSRCAR